MSKESTLAKYLGVDEDKIVERHDNSFEVNPINGGEYLVLTDDEADKLWDEELDDYLDECVLYEWPEIAQRYFDRKAWKRDARYDGRGHSLARYDDEEHDVDDEEDGVTYYIYRVN